MFTGIVQAVGRIVRFTPDGTGARLRIDAPSLGFDDVAIGDSIAVSGCCLTAVARDATGFEADVSAETLACTAGFRAEAHVNLEKALRAHDRLGGHLMTGHVDGVGEVAGLERVGDNRVLTFRMPAGLARYVARKGSIAVDGVSLTVNLAEADRFSVNLIPHTLAVTTLHALEVGSRVNLEVDLIARYVERMLASGPEAS